MKENGCPEGVLQNKEETEAKYEDSAEGPSSEKVKGAKKKTLNRRPRPKIQTTAPFPRKTKIDSRTVGGGKPPRLPKRKRKKEGKKKALSLGSKQTKRHQRTRKGG